MRVSQSNRSPFLSSLALLAVITPTVMTPQAATAAPAEETLAEQPAELESTSSTSDTDLEDSATAVPDPEAATASVRETTELDGPGRPSVLTPPPRPGTGRMAAGAYLLVAGAINVVGGTIILGLSERGDDQRRVGGVALGLGFAMAGTSAFLLASGMPARERHRQWQASSGITAPSGNGFLAVGGIIAGAGFTTTVFGAADRNRSAVASGVISMGLGAVLLGVGGARRSRYNRVLRERRLAIAPTYDAERRMGGLVLAGKF